LPNPALSVSGCFDIDQRLGRPEQPMTKGRSSREEAAMNPGSPVHCGFGVAVTLVDLCASQRVEISHRLASRSDPVVGPVGSPMTHRTPTTP
jgi:hypothetical protein